MIQADVPETDTVAGLLTELAGAFGVAVAPEDDAERLLPLVWRFGTPVEAPAEETGASAHTIKWRLRSRLLLRGVLHDELPNVALESLPLAAGAPALTALSVVEPILSGRALTANLLPKGR